MSWQDWAMLENCSAAKIICNWLFVVGSIIVSKLIADWVDRKWPG